MMTLGSWGPRLLGLNTRRDASASTGIPLRSFLWFRWVASAVLALGCTLAALRGSTLPLLGLGLALVWPVASNVIIGAQVSSRMKTVTLPVVLALDAVFISVVLAMFGGASNPFSVLLLIWVTFAAVTLPAVGAWVLCGVCTLAYGVQFLIPATEHMHGSHGMLGFDHHLRGMWFAFSLAAVVITFLVTRVTRSLATQRDALERARHMTAVGSTAARAAHELGSPLSTIAVVSKDMAGRFDGDPVLRAQAELVRDEVDRCRHILHRMAAHTGRLVGEQPESVRASSLMEALCKTMDPHRRERFTARLGTDPSLRVPPRAFCQALDHVVQNGFDASGPADSVVLSVKGTDRSVCFSVMDRGHGMDRETLLRATEPSLSHKEGGMGLGLFLTDSLVRELGGAMRIESKPGAGTTVELEVPR